MDIDTICCIGLFLMISVFPCSAKESLHEIVSPRTFPTCTIKDVGSSFFESECSPSRTNFTISAVLNFLRYNHDPSSGQSRILQYWTDVPWPEVPTMEYVIGGIKISDMKMRIFHFSVKHPAVEPVLSIFLVSFLHHEEFKFCVYFNENMGNVGFSFHDAVGASNHFRRVPKWPYLGDDEISIQETFLERRWENLK